MSEIQRCLRDGMLIMLTSNLQGWIVTFLREDLGGTDAIGYAATGFWLGIAAGENGCTGEFPRVLYLTCPSRQDESFCLTSASL